MSDLTLLEKCVDDFPSLKKERNGKSPVYLDSACTTLVPQQVIAAMDEYYNDYPACGGRRSHHWFAQEVTKRVEGNEEENLEGARHKLAKFINAESEDQIIFTLNTTHAINTVALGFPFNQGDVVLVSGREHNSNLLPWLHLQNQGRIFLDHLNATSNDDFDLNVFEDQLKKKEVRLVSLAWTSNVTGTTLPAREIIFIAHRYGALVMLDGAQTVPHQPVDVQNLDVDFLAFSIHKMCGPRGIGILYGKKSWLGLEDNSMLTNRGRVSPAILGGGTVIDSTYDSYKLLQAPECFEAGIQNYPGMIASGAAVKYLQRIGMDRINNHEVQMNEYLTKILLERYGDLGWFTIIGPKDAKLRGGILSFEVRRPNAVGIAKELNDYGNVMIRDGVFCVHSYFNDRYGLGWTHPKTHHDHRMIYRVSFYLYNTRHDCDIFLETLDQIFRDRSYVD